MSISDEDAAYIKKDPRPAKIGYKPQLGRSGNGFIPVCKVPKGNAADSKEFIPVLDLAIENTKAAPSLVSVDDGYSSKSNLEDAKERGVATVSISGSKGKRITPESDWDSPAYLEARRNRSEGLIIFVGNPEIPMDNNKMENGIRPCALGRNNYIGNHSLWGGELSSCMYSIIQTCKQNNINPRTYLQYYLEKCIEKNGDMSQEEINSMLPRKLKNNIIVKNDLTLKKF